MKRSSSPSKVEKEGKKAMEGKLEICQGILCWQKKILISDMFSFHHSSKYIFKLGIQKIQRHRALRVPS